MSETTTPAPAPASTPAPDDQSIPPWERPEPSAPARPPAPVEPKPDPEPEPEHEDKPDKPEETDDQKRNARLAFEAREARRQARVLQAELERRDREAQARGDPETEEQRIDRAVQQRLAAYQQQAREADFTKECNAIYEAGMKEYPDFQTTIASFGEIGGLTPAVIEAASEAGDAHRILAYLGRNIDEAETISKMSPARMGAAIAKIAQKAEVQAAPPPRTISRAPAPIRPIGGAARATIDPDRMSTPEWIEYENKRDRERGKR